MKRGFIICLLVIGLSYAKEDNSGTTETRDISKTTGANINFRFLDKNKRGATKLTNTDNPSFNHLSTSTAVSSALSSSGTSSGFKPSTAISSPPAVKYLYNQQYYQPNPYLTYVQLPQAAQIASQYSFQSSPVAHFLQTPTQIQYVATPTVAQVPQIKYQSYSNEPTSTNTAVSDSTSSPATSSQYLPQSQQTAAVSSQSFVSAAPTGASSSTASAPQTKQIQVPFYSEYQAVQPVYYTQQPLLTYFQQPQASNFIYHQPNANYLLKQQLSNLYRANNFGLYSPIQNNQLTYLVPMVVSQPEQDSTTTTSSAKSSDKTLSNTQHSVSGNSFAFGTKA